MLLKKQNNLKFQEKINKFLTYLLFKAFESPSSAFRSRRLVSFLHVSDIFRLELKWLKISSKNDKYTVRFLKFACKFKLGSAWMSWFISPLNLCWLETLYCSNSARENCSNTKERRNKQKLVLFKILIIRINQKRAKLWKIPKNAHPLWRYHLDVW